MTDQHVGTRYVGCGEQVVEVGDHLGGVARHRHRVTSPGSSCFTERDRPTCVCRGDHRTRPVVHADPVRFRESGKHGGCRCVVRTICNSGPSVMRSELDTLSGSVSRQLSNDRGECSSGIGADDNVGEAAHFPSPLDFLDGRLRVAGKHQQRVRRS